MSTIDTTGTYGNASGTASNVNADGTVKKSSANATVSQDQFLQLLVTQLKNQDPNNPTDQTQMLAQLAQFSSLNEMTSLNQTLSSSSQFGLLSQSAAMIGKTVTGSNGITGVVSSVAMQNGKSLLHLTYNTAQAQFTGSVSGDQPKAFEKTLKVNDPKGGAHNVTFSFTPSSTPSVWNLTAAGDPSDTQVAGVTTAATTATLNFNPDGTCNTSLTNGAIQIAYQPSAGFGTGMQNVPVDFSRVSQANGATSVSGTATQQSQTGDVDASTITNIQ